MSIERLKEVIPKDFTLDIDFLDKSVKKLNLNRNSKILDVGTGFGIMAIILALNGYNVLTGEPENDPIRDEHGDHSCYAHHDHHAGHEKHFDYNWQNHVKAVGVQDKIKFQYLDARKLEFPDKIFDGIFLYDALQHIDDMKKALSECLRVLAPTGLLADTEINKKGIKYIEGKEGWSPKYCDPREILDQKDISIKVMTGRFSNMYVIQLK